MTKVRLATAVAGSVLVAGLVVFVGTAMAQEKASIAKIADAVKKGDMATAKKLAAAYAKKNSDVDELMTAFKPAKKGGLGVGDSEQGIEQTLNKVGRDAPSAAMMAKMGDAYAQMGYDIAALALITAELGPDRDQGKKTKKAWQEWAEGMVDAGKAVASAKSAADLKTAASKVNNNCNSCHSTFR